MSNRLIWGLVAGGVALVLVIVIVIAASGDDDDGETEAQEPTATTEPEPTATEEPEPTATPEPEPEPTATPEPEPEPTATAEPEPTATGEPEPTATSEPEPVRGVIEESFVGAQLVPYSSTPIVDGDVFAYWNNGSEGTLIVIYHGPGVEDPSGLCPGNSIATDAGFEYVSNAPAAPGACDGFPTDLGEVRVCTSGVWLYNSKVPNNSEGTLFGSLEILNENGEFDGMTSQAENQPDTPEINWNADIYDISPMFTNDGSTEITCGEVVS